MLKSLMFTMSSSELIEILFVGYGKPSAYTYPDSPLFES